MRRARGPTRSSVSSAPSGSAAKVIWRSERSLSSSEERVEHGGGVKPGRAVLVERNVALVELEQPPLPLRRDRALLGEQGAGAELKGDRPDIRVVEPLVPLAQIPYPAGHEDRGLVEPHLGHGLAQLADPGQRLLGFVRVLAVGQPVMPAGAPRVLVDHAAQPLGELVVGPLPERAEGPRGRDDGVVMHPVLGGDLGDPVGHSGAAGHAVDKPLGPGEHAAQDALGAGHLPQDVHVDAALAAGQLVRDARLADAALDRIGEEFLVALAPRPAAVAHRDQLAPGIVGIRVHPGERADPARRRPRAAALPVGDGDALAALDERRNLLAGDHHWPKVSQLPPPSARNAAERPI